MSLYVHGQTKIPESIPEEKIKKQRELEQHQRYLERKIRRYKRLEAGTIDAEQAKVYAQKRKQTQAELKAFIAENDDVLKRDYFREKVYEGEGLTSEREGGKIEAENRMPDFVKSIDTANSEEIQKVLDDFQNEVIDEKFEHACIITKSGEVYRTYGTSNNVKIEALGDKLIGATVSHNHPITETAYSFSNDDVSTFYKNQISELIGFDEKYEYKLSRVDLTIDVEPKDWQNEEDFQHTSIINYINVYYANEFGYTRKKRG